LPLESANLANTGTKTPDVSHNTRNNQHRYNHACQHQHDYESRIGPGQNHSAHRHEVFSDAGGDVRRRLGTGVDCDPGRSFGSVRAERQTAAHQKCNDLYAFVEITESSRSQHSAGRNANECMNSVPGAIDDRDLIRDELDRVKAQRRSRPGPCTARQGARLQRASVRVQTLSR